MSWVVAPAMVIAAVLFDPTLMVSTSPAVALVYCMLFKPKLSCASGAMSTQAADAAGVLVVRNGAYREGVARLELKNAALIEAGRDAQHVELGIQFIDLLPGPYRRSGRRW